MFEINLSTKTKTIVIFALVIIAFLLWTTFIVGWEFAPYYYNIPEQTRRAFLMWKYGTVTPDYA